METSTTRRSVLHLAFGAGVATVAGAGFATSEVQAATSGAIRPEFLAAERRFRDFERKASRYETLICVPARQRLDDAVARLPHVTARYEAISGSRMFSTANRIDVASARGVASILRGLPEAERRERLRDPNIVAARSIAAAHHRRERAIARLPERVALTAANERSNRLGEESGALEDAFYSMPVQSLAELAHKLTVMTEREADYEGCVERVIMPDVRALIAREGRS